MQQNNLADKATECALLKTALEDASKALSETMTLLQESNEKVKLLGEQLEQQECQRKLLLKELEQQQSKLTETNENCDKVFFIIYLQLLSGFGSNEPSAQTGTSWYGAQRTGTFERRG